VPANGKDRVVATEGGHVAFAPTTEEEIEVLRVIMREHKRVSIERLLSGRGLVNIYRALCTLSGTPCAFLYADEITGAAISGRNPVAARAVDLFCAVLGSAAGDAVLASGARGGVLLGGGILTKIEDLFLKSDFIDRFTDKGRMRFYVEDVPVRLIIRDGAALVGAARRLKDRLETH
jgi:glucokinase